MKYIKFLLVVFALFMGVNAGYAQNRDIILVHGFGDLNTSTFTTPVWGIYQPFLQNILNNRPSGGRGNVTNAVYRTGNGVATTTGGTNAVATVSSQITANPQNIAIGQSMGGIVLRELDRQSPSVNFGGLITLGSPNRGGVLLNALQNGAVQAELNDGCNHLGSVISSTTFALSVISPGAAAGVGFALGGSVLAFKNSICNDIINDLNFSLPTQTSPLTIADLSEGSNIITNLNNSNTPTFKIGVFGVENSPVHMRVLSSLDNDPFSTTSTADDTDEEFVDLFNTVNDIAVVSESILMVTAIFLSVNAIWNWPLLFPAAICAWAGYEWAALRRWLNQSESKWHATIGAGGFFTEQRLVNTFVCQDQLMVFDELYSSGQITKLDLSLARRLLFQDATCFQLQVRTFQMPINNESDGMFNAGTQRIPNDPNSATHVVNIPVQGVNHREFFNHQSMTAAFNQILSGATPADIFFITN